MFQYILEKNIFMKLNDCLIVSGNNILSSVLFLCGVVVLELESHPGHNKGSDHAFCACPKTYWS